jgi:hypothetical protein
MRTCVRALALVILASCRLAHAEGPADRGFRKLEGRQIGEAFSGRNFTNETHFSNHYRGDATIDGYSMGRRIANTWKIVGDDLCITERSQEYCYAVWENGTDVQLISRDYDITLYGTLK